MRVFIAGAGQMGQGIAQVFAERGHEVLLNDVDERRVRHGIEAIGRVLERNVERGRMTAEQRGRVLEHIDPRTHFHDLDVELAIEAATEDVATKLDLFRRLDTNTAPETILASNTSSISITQLARVTSKPERVIGMHFMNPVPVMALVEVIRGIATSDATAHTIVELARSLGKTPVESRDFPGFVVNRILMPMINEAIFTLYEGVASIEAIDTAMKLGTNQPMGPLTLADFIGLDTCLAILEVMHAGLGDPKYRPCPLLRQYVAAGWLGRKSGRGFYSYPSAPAGAAATPARA